jgi:hypothetical protein
MATGILYLERLTRDDLRLLADVERARDRAATPERLAGEPDRLLGLLAGRRTYETVFGTPDDPAGLATPVSPFLIFAVALHRAAAELEERTYTSEWVGPNRRLPVFDVAVLRDFASDPMRRLFLVELLASYTHVASGATWERTPRGWRRRRFSELDPAQLASLLDVVPDSERPGVYRRLGDLSLFLTGVFPDHTTHRFLAPVQRDRLMRVSGAEGLPGSDVDSELGAVALLEELGVRWYRLAARSARPPLTATMQVATSVAERFRAARRILNDVTDRYLLPRRGHLFGLN